MHMAGSSTIGTVYMAERAASYDVCISISTLGAGSSALERMRKILSLSSLG